MKWMKTLGKILFILMLIAVLLWIAFLGVLQTKLGQRWVLKKASLYIEETTDVKIKAKKFNLSFPLTLSLEDVSINQGENLIATIKKVELSSVYAAFLQGRVIFSHLNAKEINFIKIPSFIEGASNSSSSPWDKTFLPFYLRFENINIEALKLSDEIRSRINLPPELAKFTHDSLFNLNGYASNNPFKSALTLHLLVTSKNEKENITPFTLGIDTSNHHLSLSFHSNHVPLQMINEELASQVNGHLALFATGSTLTWEKFADSYDHSDSNIIEGHFKLSLTPLEQGHDTPTAHAFSPHAIFKGEYRLKSLKSIEIKNFTAIHPHFSLKGRATINSNRMIEAGHFVGKMNDLNALIPEVKGTLSFEGKLSGSLSSPSIDLQIESPSILSFNKSFEHIHSKIKASVSQSAINGNFSLSCHFDNAPWEAATAFLWQKDEKLTLSKLAIESREVKIEGDLATVLPFSRWEGDLEASFNDLRHFSKLVDLPLEGEGKMHLHLSSLEDEKGSVSSTMGKSSFSGRSLRFGDWSSDDLLMDMEIGSLADNHMFLYVEGRFQANDLKYGEGSVEKSSGSFTHHLDLKTLSLSQIHLEADINQIQWREYHADLGKGNIRLDNLQTLAKGQLSFTLSELQAPSLYLDELSGSTTIQPSQSSWPFDLQGKGKWKEEINFAIHGDWHSDKNDFSLEIEQLTGKMGSYPLLLKNPLHFKRVKDTWDVTDVWAQLGEGEFKGNFHIDSHQIQGEFSTNELSSELFRFVAPELPLTGKASFQAKLEGAIKSPKGELRMDLKQIQIHEELLANKPHIDGYVLFLLDDQGIKVESHLNGIGNQPLLISGQLPYQLEMFPPSLKQSPHLPFHLNLNAEGELDPYLQLFYTDATNLSGHTKIVLSVEGELFSPQIKGSVDFTDGVYESLTTGALYQNIQAHLEGDGSKIVLTKLSAENGKSGNITASGEVHVDVANKFPFHFEIQPSHIFILDSDYIDVAASGILSLEGNTEKSKLIGELSIDQANIHLEEALPRNIKKVDVQFVNVPKEDLLHFQKLEKHSPIEFDVSLKANQNVLIEDKHLDSSWTGSIAVTGTPQHPLLNGDLRLVQGEYDFNGKVFNLSQGNIHFAGAVDKKTSIYVVANKDIDKINAEIILKGLVTKPVISFRSTPPLSQREILSYILFNRGISDITQNQGDQLSQSFISLNSNDQTKDSTDFLSRLRNRIGLDRLDFTANDTPQGKDVGLQIGKHITEDIIVSVNQGMTSLSPVISVEAKLRKNLKAQAEAGVGQDAPIRTSIKWKKDY